MSSKFDDCKLILKSLAKMWYIRENWFAYLTLLIATIYKRHSELGLMQWDE